MTSATIALPDADATDHLGRTLATAVRAGDQIALSGTLGAGKTSLARGILRGLGLAGEAPSPSFAIVVAYEPPEVVLPVWHVDLYRLERPKDVIQFGINDARLDAAIIVEWPERAPLVALHDALHLTIHADGAGRCLTWTAPAAWERRWPPSNP